MSEYRTSASRFGVVAAVISVSLLLFPPAFSQDAGSRTPRQTVGVRALRHIQARITGIDPLYNSVTLRDPRGEMAVIEISPDVADVNSLQLGDTVKIAYRSAILTHLTKVASSGIRAQIETEVVQPTSDGEANSTRSVEFLATVLKIDRKNREVTLRGPTQTEEFDVAPDFSLSGLKIGDSVRATFVAARAASVERVGTAPQ